MEVKFSSEVIKVENIIYGWYYLIQEVKCSLKKKKKSEMVGFGKYIYMVNGEGFRVSFN